MHTYQVDFVSGQDYGSIEIDLMCHDDDDDVEISRTSESESSRSTLYMYTLYASLSDSSRKAQTWTH